MQFTSFSIVTRNIYLKSLRQCHIIQVAVISWFRANSTFNKKSTRGCFKHRAKRRRRAIGRMTTAAAVVAAADATSVRYTCGISREKKPSVGRVPPKLRNYYSSRNALTWVSPDCIKEDAQGEQRREGKEENTLGETNRKEGEKNWSRLSFSQRDKHGGLRTSLFTWSRYASWPSRRARANNRTCTFLCTWSGSCRLIGRIHEEDGGIVCWRTRVAWNTRGSGTIAALSLIEALRSTARWGVFAAR